MSSKIILKDPLYKQILLSERHKNIIDTKEFQRLRYIKQTSFSDYVYPSANHTRFSHSLGAHHLMKKVLDNGLMKIPDKKKENLVLAALLHDIGHGPFSHIWELAFPHFDHEKTTQEILKKNLKLPEVAKIVDKKSDFWQLLSSTIDVDKLDYMARDSYFAGVSYGVAEVDFIIQHMKVVDDKLVIKPSAVSSVEDLITQRVNLFKTVYFHKVAAMYDFLFTRIFRRVGELLKTGKEVYVNNHLKAFFEKKDTLNDLLALNDIVIISHIYEWANSDDKILSYLANMFIERKKFNVKNLAHNEIDIEKLRQKVGEKYDIDYYFGYICLPIKIVQTPIYVEFDGEFKKLEEVSDLIKFYKDQSWKVEYVIYPIDIKE